MLGELETRPERVVIADLEAGVGTLLRASAEQVDLAVIVVEPYKKSIETARRLIDIVRENGIARWLLVGNKIRDDDDLELIRSGLKGAELDLVVPTDQDVVEADLAAEAPVDRNPDSPAVKVIRELALQLAG